MMPSVRSFLRLVLLCAALAGSALGFAADVLTEADVRTLITEMERESERNNPAGVVKFIAADASIVSVKPRPDGSTATSTKVLAEHLAAEVEAQKQYPDNSYESSAPQITLSADGRTATAAFTATQRFTDRERRVVATAHQVATVELRDGKPVVTKIQSTMSGLSIDGRTIF